MKAYCIHTEKAETAWHRSMHEENSRYASKESKKEVK